MNAEPLVEIGALRRSFGGDPPVVALAGVDFVVRRGDYVAVMGRSGSGKSTLMNLLGLLDQPTGGTYVLAGRPVEDLSEADRTRIRAERIGFVFQQFHLLDHRSAEENVELALLHAGQPRADRRARARAALERVGLGHRRSFLPRTLSGGERQRVAIARALVTEPALLLCDEPTGNLDSATAESILDLFDALHASGLTLVVVTHDEAVARRAVRQVRMTDGHLTERLV